MGHDLLDAELRADELAALARGVLLFSERREKDEHPINRIMRIEEGTDEIRFSTTEPHLAQAIGRRHTATRRRRTSSRRWRAPDGTRGTPWPRRSRRRAGNWAYRWG